MRKGPVPKTHLRFVTRETKSELSKQTGTPSLSLKKWLLKNIPVCAHVHACVCLVCVHVLIGDSSENLSRPGLKMLAGGTVECTTISDGGRIFKFTGEAPYKENRESETGIKQQKKEKDWGT